MGQYLIETPKIQEPRRFFIIYKRDSALDLVKHLHDALHERGVDVFLDTVDLKEGLSAVEWREQIDEAIEKAQVFVFVVTHSASTSNDIKRELKKARDSAGKEIKAFVHSHIWTIDQELMITLDGEHVDIRSFQIRQFETKESLVREVADSTLVMRIIEPRTETASAPPEWRRLDLRFDHIEAWLFFGPEISYEKGERNPRKNNPRKKLVCNTKTLKAYYVDDIIWNMIYNNRIRWHSEDDQDLQKWCKRMGYKLVKRDAREANLLDLG